MQKKYLENGLVRISNGEIGIIDTRNGRKYNVADISEMDITFFIDSDAKNDEQEVLVTNALEYEIRKKIAEIDAYDTSESVNSFSYKGENFWLDKETRVGLVNSTNMLKASGHDDTTLWLGDVSVTLKCDQVLQMLCALECYALECYNVTARHKAEVKALQSVAEVEAYDIKSGYPTKLAF